MHSASLSRATPARRTRHRRGLFALLALWRSRRSLAELDLSRLDDIGVSAEEAHAEARRPIWDVPKDWRR